MSINPLVLEGWDHLSTWGTEYGEFYAQLTPNGISDDNGPQIWITPPRYVVSDESSLAHAIATATGASIDDVLLAMQGGAGPDDHDASGLPAPAGTDS